MATSLGALVVSLGLNAAEFTQGLTKAEFQAKKFGNSLSNEIASGIVKAEVALKLLGDAAAFAIRGFPELIEQAGRFQDLAEKTGASAESLASFSLAAQVAGKSVDDVATFMVKLSKNLVSVDDDASKAAIGLKALGIPIQEFKNLDPAAQIDALSKALAKFNNLGGGKAAALEQIARGGAELLPFLKELEESGGRQVTLTNAQIKKADEFSDAMKRSRAEINVFAQIIAVDASGAVAALTAAVKDFIGQLIGINNESKKLRDDNAIADWANNAARAIAFIGDAADGVGRIFNITGNVIGATAAQIGALAEGDLQRYNAIQQDASDVIDGIIKKQTLRFHLEKNISDQAKRAAADQPPSPDTRPTLPIPSTGNAAAAAAKKMLEGQLKALDDFVRSEQDTLRDREQFLGTYYQNDLIGLRDFFAGRRAAQQEAAEKEIAAFDKEAALLTAFAKRAKPTDRIEAETKLADVMAKRAKVQQEVATNSIKLTLDEDQAMKRFTDSIEQASIVLQEMRGDTVGAAQAGFDFANRRIKTQLAELAKSARPEDQALAGVGQRDLEATRQLVILRAQLNKATESYSQTLDELGIAQARIQIAENIGAISSLQAFEKRQALSKQYVQQLQEQLPALEAIAQAEGKREDIIKVAKLRLEMEQIAAKALVDEKKAMQDFANTLTNAFADSFEGFIDGTKSAKDAFRDFANSIQKYFTQLALHKIGDAIFGSTTAAGPDIFSMLPKLLGIGGSTATGAVKAATDATGATVLAGSATALTGAGGALTASSGALDGSAVAQTTAAGLLSGAAGALSGAAIALTTASAASTGSDIAGLLGSGIGLAQGGGLASGSNFTFGGGTWVGEHGPEFVDMPRGARVWPSGTGPSSMNGGDTITINMQVLPGANTQTARQAGNFVRDAVSARARDR